VHAGVKWSPQWPLSDMQHHEVVPIAAAIASPVPTLSAATPPTPGGNGFGPGFDPQRWQNGRGFHHRYGSPWSWALHQFSSGFGGQLIVAALIVVFALVAAFLVRGRRPWVLGMNPSAACLALGSLAVIAVSTLTPRSNAFTGGSIQLVPFHTLRAYRWQPADLLIYAGGNVALFAPLGFFLYLALRRWVWRTTIACALVSITVEILQIPIWSRSTDIDDVITNTLGGFAGAVLGAIVLYLARRGYLGRRLAAAVSPTPEHDNGERRTPALFRTPAAASASGPAASPWPL
jgi:VanZ family protein